MATAAGMRAYLRDVIGLTDTAGVDPNARRDAVRNEGLDSIQDFIEFDEEGIRTLCASVRKPGGTIIDPTDGTRRIQNPGISIPAIAEKRMKWAAYGARIYDLIGRPITADGLSRARLREFEDHFRVVNEHEDPENLPTISKTFGIMKALDALPVHLRERYGVCKVPLVYIIRQSATPIALEPLGIDKITSDNYDSVIDEMIVTVQHTGPNYAEDNAKVFQVISDIIAGSSHEASIKAHRRARDGRAAYLALQLHNMGSSKWDRIIDDCENYLLKREWNGRNYRFTLKSHIAKHRDAHNELSRASEFVTYELPNEHTRVSRSIKSVTSRDPSIVAAITHIQGDNTRRNDFELAADFMLLNAPAPKEMQENHRVSALGTGTTAGNGNGDKNMGKTGIELRYYKRDEYNRLNNAQKRELHEWRKSNKKKGKGSRSSNDDNENHEGQSRISALESQIEQLINLNKELSQKVSAVASTTNNETNRNRNPLTMPLNQRSDS